MKEAYVDHTQFDKKDVHFDASSKPDNPKWSMVNQNQYIQLLTGERADEVSPLPPSGWRPVSKDDEALHPSVGAEKVPPAAPRSGRSPEGRGALHQSQALRAAADLR